MPENPAHAPDAVPAHALYVELATRVTTQRLHYRSGDEETAATSIYSLFKTTREWMVKHPDAHAFQRAALALLNDTLRPYTARWHGWMTQDSDRTDKDGKPVLKFRDEWVRRTFREELTELQPQLFGFQKAFHVMSLGGDVDPRWLEAKQHEELLAELTRECQTLPERALLGNDLAMKLRSQVTLRVAGPAGRLEQDTSAAAKIEYAEAMEIRERRAQMRLSAGRDDAPRTPVTDPVAGQGDAAPADPAAVPVIMNAAGLALSGGGIRSATFCLGIVQALQEYGLFTQFDYLSTVSGGGYLGAFISSYLGADPVKLSEAEGRIARLRNQPLSNETQPVPITPDDARRAEQGGDARARVKEAFRRPDSGSSESPAIRHLRNNARYLLNGGGWGLLRIGGVLVTGFLTSLLMLLTVPLAVAWAVRGIKEPAVADFFEAHLWLLEPWRVRSFAIVTALAVLAAILCAVRQGANGRAVKLVLGVGAVAGAFWVVATVRALGLWVVYANGPGFLQAWRHPAGISLAGVLSLLLVCWLLIPFCQRLAQGTKWDSAAEKTRSVVESTALVLTLAAVANAALCAVYPVVRGYERLGDSLGAAVHHLIAWKPPEAFVTALLSVVSVVFAGLTKRKDGSVRSWAQWLFYLTAPTFFLLVFLVFASHLGVGDEPTATARHLGYAGVATGVLLLWVFAFLNINTFAPHRYYRDRLCECYLAVRNRLQRSWLKRMMDRIFHAVPDHGATELFPGVGTLRRLPLSALSASAAAPYHLINATLNAAASKNPSLRGRNGDFFIFSRHYCGSPLTGYMTTEDLEKVDPYVDLGTAMAISGAAASTNMGWRTLRQLRFLMTLFNVRLGYWMRRPGSTGRWRPFEGPGPLYFLREMLGAVHEKTPYVNLSDGGHIENLAAYELLRRRCKFIVCVDASMEPGMECADLMRLQRYAAIDFGVRMHFDPADLTLLPTNYSRAYAVLVKIDYDPPQEAGVHATSQDLGWLLYLKLAVTGTEPRYVLDYRRQNPAFPHQTTADQFYDEAQFEAYRVLGECAAESLFRPEIVGSLPLDRLGIKDWFQAMADNLLPDNDEAFS